MLLHICIYSFSINKQLNIFYRKTKSKKNGQFSKYTFNNNLQRTHTKSTNYTYVKKQVK